MKKIAAILSIVAILTFAACADNSSDASDQKPADPVMNSGANTEGERAQEAVKDSLSAGGDSTIRHDADAPSTPH